MKNGISRMNRNDETSSILKTTKIVLNFKDISPYNLYRESVVKKKPRVNGPQK
jgi:hypothetical protein